ncbi:MAG: hypothetical protein M1118_06175 [Chloroflexi bacterium]|nr:hypothetical protein [Chloroflexota bacterium]
MATDGTVTVRIDLTTQTVAVELAGPTVSLEDVGIVSAVVQSDEEAERLALFLTTEEAEVLQKMVDYVLERVKISISSRSTLEGLTPRLSAFISQAQILT